MFITDKHGRKFEIPDQNEQRVIQQGIAADPDAYELSDAQLAQLRPLAKMRTLGRPKADSVKERVTIRLSPEVTEFFRASGKGWQTRMNDALKEYVRSHRS